MAARVLELRVQIPLRAWMSRLWVLCRRGRGLRDGPTTRPESFRLWCI